MTKRHPEKERQREWRRKAERKKNCQKQRGERERRKEITKESKRQMNRVSEREENTQLVGTNSMANIF